MDTEEAGPGLIPPDGRMLESGRVVFAMPSVDARGLAVVDVAQATLAAITKQTLYYLLCTFYNIKCPHKVNKKYIYIYIQRNQSI